MKVVDGRLIKWATEAAQVRAEMPAVHELPSRGYVAKDCASRPPLSGFGATRFEALKDLKRQLIRDHVRMGSDERVALHLALDGPVSPGLACPVCLGVPDRPDIAGCCGCLECDFHGTSEGYQQMRSAFNEAMEAGETIEDCDDEEVTW